MGGFEPTRYALGGDSTLQPEPGKPLRYGRRHRGFAAEGVRSRDPLDHAVWARRRDPESVAFALDYQRRDPHRVELRQADILGLARRMEREREAEDGRRARLARGPA